MKTWVSEGRTSRLDFRYGGVSPEHTTELVADAVASKPDLIITQARCPPRPALTTTIPIVAIYSGDLVNAAW